MKQHLISADLGIMTLIVSMIGSPAGLHAQRAEAPRLAGVHFGLNLMNFNTDPIDVARLGAQVALPIVGPVTFYPMAAVGLDRAAWQLSALTRVDFTPGRTSNPLYLGAGVSLLNWEGRDAQPAETTFYDVLFLGLKAAVREYQPFVELEFLDAIHRVTTGYEGDFGVQLYVGINRVFR
jgi:hypothetical protein